MWVLLALMFVLIWDFRWRMALWERRQALSSIFRHWFGIKAPVKGQ
jgi:hypothetical protein